MISPYPHRLSDVLENLRSHVVEGDLDLASDLSIGVVGHADAAGLGNALEASSDIYAVANRAAPFFRVVPVFGSVMAIVFLGERPQPFHVIGFVLVLTGVFVASRKQAKAS